MLGDHETQAYPVDVHLLVVLDESKKFEKLVLILFGNANPSVNDLHFQKFIVCFNVFNNFYSGFYEACLGKFESIGLKPYNDLHNPLLITANHGAVALWYLSWFLDSDKFRSKVQVFVDSLLFLHLHYLLNGVSDVNDLEVLSEFASLNLGVIKQVLDDKVHKLSRVLLSVLRFIELAYDVNAVLKFLSFLDVLREFVKVSGQLVVKSCFLYVFSHYGV